MINISRSQPWTEGWAYDKTLMYDAINVPYYELEGFTPVGGAVKGLVIGLAVGALLVFVLR